MRCTAVEQLRRVRGMKTAPEKSYVKECLHPLISYRFLHWKTAPRTNDELDSTSRLHALRRKQFEDIRGFLVIDRIFDDDVPGVLSFSFPFRLNTDFFLSCTNNTKINDDTEASAKGE